MFRNIKTNKPTKSPLDQLFLRKKISSSSSFSSFTKPKCESIFYTKSKQQWNQFFKEREQYGIVGQLGFQLHEFEEGWLKARVQIERQHMAPNGYLHAASVIFLADTSCGFGCFMNLPSWQHSFTTAELKSNHLGTAKEGHLLECEARLQHGGRNTHVWDATVYDCEQRKPIALFRCTQMILAPRPGEQAKKNLF